MMWERAVDDLLEAVELLLDRDMEARQRGEPLPSDVDAAVVRVADAAADLRQRWERRRS